MEPDVPLHIYIVSDATGKTGWRVVEAALLQFDASDVVVERVGGVQDEAGVYAAMEQAKKTRGLVIHTLVSPSLRRAILEGGRQRGIITIDLLGPVLTRLTEALQISPKAVPGLFRQLDDEYFARIDAIEYTVNHDDGRNPEQLDRADLVLVGVSRTGKTPLSVFLAYRGWRVANIPIVLGVDRHHNCFGWTPGVWWRSPLTGKDCARSGKCVPVGWPRAWRYSMQPGSTLPKRWSGSAESCGAGFGLWST
jgi:hypothetical protein